MSVCLFHSDGTIHFVFVTMELAFHSQVSLVVIFAKSHAPLVTIETS